MTTTPRNRRLYRTITANSPTRDDVLSYAELGKELPENVPPDVVDRWQGISMYDSEQRAGMRSGSSWAGKSPLSICQMTIASASSGRGDDQGTIRSGANAETLLTFIAATVPV